MLSLLRRKRAWVLMVASVGGHEAGLRYKLPIELADSYVARGYADGTLSREFSRDELNALRSTTQTVTFDG